MKSAATFHDGTREWIWKLHNRVNEQRGAPTMPLEEAIELYREKGTRDLQQSLEKLMEVLDRAKLQRQVDGAFVRDWNQRLGTFRRFVRV
jgi:hypothetical protein